MPYAQIVGLGHGRAGLLLSAVRQVADAESRSDPHITLRYPIRRIRRHFLPSLESDRTLILVVRGPGIFETSKGVAVYLECASEYLESYAYKPDFPDSVFHLTLYEGVETEYAQQLYDLLSEFRWGLAIEASSDSIEEVPIGAAGYRTRRSARFTPEVLEELSRVAPNCKAEAVEGLSGRRRLALIRLLIEELHESLVQADSTPPRPLVFLESEDPVERQGSLWQNVGGAELSGESDGAALPVGGLRGGDLVLTPPELAEDIVLRALEAHGGRPIDFGDPSFGSGIFFAVLNRELRSQAQLTSAFAVEVNKGRAEIASRRWRASGLQMGVGDFLEAKPARRWNFVIANPPYVRSQDLDETQKARARARVKESLGVEVSSRANLYVYFMLLGHRWMREGATAAWLLPSDFMESRYGSVLRSYLTDEVNLRQIHTYDPGEYRFENVRVAPSVVIFSKTRADESGEVVLSRGGTLADPRAASSASLGDLRSARNWRIAFKGTPWKSEGRSLKPALGDLFSIRRGIATGAKEYFVLTGEDVDRIGLERQHLRPVLPRSRYLPGTQIIESSEDGTPKLDRKLFLIDTDLPLDRLASSAPRLAEYLRSAPADVLKRHLVSRRTPFYRQEARAPSDFIASPMGRYSAEDGSRPVRFFLNESDGVPLNNYLVLYPLGLEGARLMPESARRVFEVLQSIDPYEFSLCGRQYPGGTIKLEPKDLANVRLSLGGPDLRELRSDLLSYRDGLEGRDTK